MYIYLIKYYLIKFSSLLKVSIIKLVFWYMVVILKFGRKIVNNSIVLK